MRIGTFMVVLGDERSGKSEFMQRLAQVNGVVDVHAMNSGSSDMFSLMRRPGGRYVGCLMLNGPEPMTDKERGDTERDPGARDAFLTRWFRRTHEVLRDSGGNFAISVRDKLRTDATWVAFADYVVSADRGTYQMLKSS